MADEQVWRIWPDVGHSFEVRASKIIHGSGVIYLQDERDEILAIINLEKTKVVFRADQLLPSPK